jgi:hypothetical protein
MTPVDEAAEIIIDNIRRLRGRANASRHDAERLIVRARRDEQLADAMAAMLEASGIGTDPEVRV